MDAELRFVKMQGVGNDFVLIDARVAPAADWPALAVELCRRRFSVGADGLLVVDRSEVADAMMRMYNPDGSPDVCGNGMRCVARWLTESCGYTAPALALETFNGVHQITVEPDAAGRSAGFTVNMGPPALHPNAIPMVAPGDTVCDFPLELADAPNGFSRLPVTCVSTGSTHAVTFAPLPGSDLEFERIASCVEHHHRFPERTSLMWARQAEDGALAIRIWERGAGETLGCGTGACATAVAAVMHGTAQRDSPVRVRSAGGELVVTWQSDGDILMSGPAEIVYSGSWAGDSTAEVMA
ncbi:MAG: diaminopimelate epimerase [Armatimonadetes bacterium]|nr:diaminopimelate epimerase [Armatimonadota bacterium]MDE2205902.1 diaminopimelate epimerase [Armatimonadota bacterium]